VDPLAGSYFIETLTCQMEEKILEEMKEIQDVGGMVAAVSKGYIQRKVARQAYEYEKGLQEGEYTKVGFNKYADDGEDQPDVDLHQYNEAWADEQVERLSALRQERDGKAVNTALEALEQAARKKQNVMPHLVECCRAYATVGEMAGVFREVFGEWQEPQLF